MNQYNTLNVKLSNSQLNKSISGIKAGTEVTLNLPSNVVVDCDNETSFPHKISTNTQVSRICKAFANGSSANKTQLSKMVQLEDLLIFLLIMLVIL